MHLGEKDDFASLGKALQCGSNKVVASLVKVESVLSLKLPPVLMQACPQYLFN
jgi:hypothetical protein